VTGKRKERTTHPGRKTAEHKIAGNEKGKIQQGSSSSEKKNQAAQEAKTDGHQWPRISTKEALRQRTGGSPEKGGRLLTIGKKTKRRAEGEKKKKKLGGADRPIERIECRTRL